MTITLPGGIRARRAAVSAVFLFASLSFGNPPKSVSETVAAAQLSTQPATAVERADAWIAGDVHVHAAGDSGLKPHVLCNAQEIDQEDIQSCADYLVRMTLEQARTNGANWVILTEHVPWLGLRSSDYEFCIFGWVCKTLPIPGYESSQAKIQYNAIADAARRLSPQIGVRGLMGQELGAAGQVTWALHKLGTDFDVPYLPESLEPNAEHCPGVEAGHFALYSQRSMIDDSVFACDEAKYLQDAKAQGAWGAVNHPQNVDDGSRWFCWNAGDTRPEDTERSADDNEEGPVCPVGAADSDETVRAVEILNDRNPPTDSTFANVDALLLEGHRVALVGGGDAHTSRPDADEPPIEFFQIGRYIFPVFNDEFLQQREGNYGKIGLVGRTFIPPTRVVGLDPDESFDPYSASDPVRLAIEAGETVATNGPLAVPSVDGVGPGGTAIIGSGEATRLELDLAPGFVAVGDGVPQEGTVPPPLQISARTATEAVVTVGRPHSCPPQAGIRESSCVQEFKIRQDFAVAEQAASGHVALDIAVPKDWSLAYIRTDTYFTDGDSKYVSLSSPIYLMRDPFSPAPTPLDDPCPRAQYPPPVGAPPTVDCLAVTPVDLNGNGSPDRLMTWRVLGSNLKDADHGMVAYLDDYSYRVLETDPDSQVATRFPQDFDILAPSAVLPLNGSREYVVVDVAYGTHARPSVLIGLTSSTGGPAPVRTTDGALLELSRGSIDYEPEFAGWINTYGCVESMHDGRLLATAYTTWPAFSPASGWELDLYRVHDTVAVAFGRAGGIALGEEARSEFISKYLDDCSSNSGQSFERIEGALSPENAVSGLLRAAHDADPQLARFFVRGRSTSALWTGTRYEEDPFLALTSGWAPSLAAFAETAPACGPSTLSDGEGWCEVALPGDAGIAVRVSQDHVTGFWSVEVVEPIKWTEEAACSPISIGIQRLVSDTWRDPSLANKVLDRYDTAPEFQGALRRTYEILRSSEGEFGGDQLSSVCLLSFE